MHVVPTPPLRGRRVLIVESDTSFLHKLMNVLEEDEHAETHYITDPYDEIGAKRTNAFTFCAAIVNGAFRDVARKLTVPVLVYGPNTLIPAEVAPIVEALKAIVPPE